MPICIEGSAGQEQPTKALLMPRCVACDRSVLHITGHRRCCALVYVGADEL